jgi:flavodoxin
VVTLQKILIIHSKKGDLKRIAEGIEEGAENKGHRVDVLSTERRGRMVSFHAYDLVIVGSPTEGFFRGSIASDLKPFLKKCKRTVGQETVAFVTPRYFATNKALKSLMGQLEELGCVVNDFKTLKSYSQAVTYGKSL